MRFAAFLGLLLALQNNQPPQILDIKLQDGYLITATCSIGTLNNVNAVIDTGITETVLDLKAAKLLSLPLTPTTATFLTQDRKVNAVSIPQIALGPLRVQSIAGIATDLSYLTHQFGIRPDVLVGMDVLGRQNFLIDYRHNQIVFGALPTLGHSAPLLTAGRVLMTAVSIGKQNLRLQVDTGFNGILIYGGKLRQVSSYYGLNEKTFGDRREGSHLVSLSSLQIGDWSGKQVTAAVNDDGPAGASPFDGLFGPRSIGVHRVGFDFEKGLMNWD